MGLKWGKTERLAYEKKARQSEITEHFLRSCVVSC